MLIRVTINIYLKMRESGNPYLKDTLKKKNHTTRKCKTMRNPVKT